MTTIRPFAPHDVSVVAKMLHGSFDRRILPYMVYGQSGIDKFLSRALEFPEMYPGRISFVSVSADASIEAFAEFRIDGAHGFLSYLCVDPGFRGKGTATHLINHFLESNPDVRELNLEVFRDNTPAFSLYTKLGFETIGSSLWVSRELPEPATELRIKGLSESLVSHRAFGFCELFVETHDGARRVGLLGDDVINCFGSDLFEDDLILAGVRGAFPVANQAFAVIDAESAENLSVEYDIVAVTNRMSLRVH